MDEIIKVNDVSMRFNLAQEKTETLKEYTVKLLTHKLFFNEFYALKHVSFSMKRGESLALIGRNGSGKSTMLKVISGVMYPSGGSVAVNGEIAPMIELGAGFDMDLTARENIFLNGAVLGHDDLGGAEVVRLGVVHLVAVEEHHDVGVLLDRAGFAQV